LKAGSVVSHKSSKKAGKQKVEHAKKADVSMLKIQQTGLKSKEEAESQAEKNSEYEYQLNSFPSKIS
jgi:hypothetical protein